MRLPISFILLIACLAIKGQETKAPSSYNHVIKFTPWSIVGMPFPAAEFSYENKTKNRFSYQVTAACLLPKGLMDIGLNVPPNYKGFNVSFEEKYYYQKGAHFGPYVAVELHYLKALYTESSVFGPEKNWTDTTYHDSRYGDTISINRQTFTLNLKWGLQFSKNHFTVDMYVGVGIRYRDVRHYNQINPNDEMETPRHPNYYYFTNRKGQYWTLNIPVNIRLGYAF